MCSVKLDSRLPPCRDGDLFEKRETLTRKSLGEHCHDAGLLVARPRAAAKQDPEDEPLVLRGTIEGPPLKAREASFDGLSTRAHIDESRRGLDRHRLTGSLDELNPESRVWRGHRAIVAQPTPPVATSLRSGRKRSGSRIPGGALSFHAEQPASARDCDGSPRVAATVL